MLKTSTTERKRTILAVIYLAARYYAAFTLFSYGFAKLMGAQFTVLDSELAKPLGEVSGFWLTWYYFGYSAAYSSFIAWAQIAGALLLCFGRTALVGTLLLLPVVLNIVFIDHWVIGWNLGVDALRIALYVFASLLVVLSFHLKELYRFLLQKRASLNVLLKQSRRVKALPAVVVFCMLGYTAHEAYWLANVNNRAPTPIDGAWQLIDSQPRRPDLPRWIYFEYNRAHMAVFQFADRSFATHDFRVDSTTGQILISKQWLTPGSDIFDGTWQRSGDKLTIQGKWNSALLARMTFRRKHMPVKDHQ